MKKIYVISISVLLMAAILSGCSGDLTNPTPVGSKYQVEGMVVRDMATEITSVLIGLDKNDSPYFDAAITLGGTALDTNLNGYIGFFGPAQILPDSSYTLNIKDGDSLNANIIVTIPGSFAIDGPAFRQFSGGAEPVQWTVSTGSDAYILATVPPDTTFIYDTYEVYVSGTDSTLPPEAFLDGDSRIIGAHSIYAASYIGAPSPSTLLPFNIPATGGPADNVSVSRVKGRIAAMVVAEADSIIVAE